MKKHLNSRFKERIAKALSKKSEETTPSVLDSKGQELKVNDRVSHAEYGEGSVRQINGPDYGVYVKYDKHSDRAVVSDASKLTKIASLNKEAIYVVEEYEELERVIDDFATSKGLSKGDVIHLLEHYIKENRTEASLNKQSKIESIDDLQEGWRVPLTDGNYGLYEKGAKWEGELSIWDLDMGMYVPIEMIDWDKIVKEPESVMKESSLKFSIQTKLTKEQIAKIANNDLRFDTDGRVEIWVTKDDIEGHKDFKKVMEMDITDEDKIVALKELAKDIAYDKVIRGGIEDTEVTVDLSLSDINVNRIDWIEMFEDYKEDKTASLKTATELSRDESRELDHLFDTLDILNAGHINISKEELDRINKRIEELEKVKFK